MMGCLRANYAVHPISTRNSPEAIAHLISKTGAAYVLVGAEKSIQTLANDALGLFDNAGNVRRSFMPNFEDLYSATGDFNKLDFIQPHPDTPAIIMHSSGN